MTISVNTYNGAPAGMSIAVPPHELPDDQCYILQDAVTTDPGVLKRRGPITAIGSALTSATSTGSIGAMQVTDPAGTRKIAVIQRNNANQVEGIVTDASGTSLGTFAASDNTTINGQYSLVSTNTNSGGPVLYSINYSINPSAQANLSNTYGGMAQWSGGAVDFSTISSGSLTFTQNSATVTGVGTAFSSTWIGSYLLCSGFFMGTIASVTSTTTLTLTKPIYGIALAPGVTSYQVKSQWNIPSWGSFCGMGYATTTTGSTSVTGVNTKWLTYLTSGAPKYLFRDSDNFLVGQVTSIQSDIALTLAANATINMTNDRYFVVSNSGYVQEAGTFVMGSIPAYFASRAWYGNIQPFNFGYPAGLAPSDYSAQPLRIYFSETHNTWATDFTQTGNWLQIPASRGTFIVAMKAMRRGLLVCTDLETFIITGYSPETFAITQVSTDGCIGPNAMIDYADGVIWAGRTGIYYYNGTNAVENLILDSVSDAWSAAVSTIVNPTTKTYLGIARDHLFVHADAGINFGLNITKAAVSTAITRPTLVINLLQKRALSLWTNFRFTSMFPAGNTKQVIATTSTSATTTRLIDVTKFFDTEGIDAIACFDAPNSVTYPLGPDFYLETKKYAMGDNLRLKVFRQIILRAYMTGDIFKVDYSKGVDTGTGTNLNNTTWTTASNYQQKKLTTMATSQVLSFKVYQNSAAMTVGRLASWQVGFKWRRAGAI
jgi:hypothetical protein